MKTAYNALASYYEYLIKDCDCDSWSQYVSERVREFAPGKSGADIACGSGIFTRALKSAGFEVTGVDVSAEMLAQAQSRGGGITYVKQDMLKLSLLKRAHFITCINDGVNYIPGTALEKFFGRVASNLVKGGFFMFDISSEYKLREIIGSNMFAEVDDDVSYVWFNRLKEDRVEMDLTVFEKTAGGLFERRDECHAQYIHTTEQIVCALTAAGFSVLRQEGHLGEPCKDNTERLNFLALKL